MEKANSHFSASDGILRRLALMARETTSAYFNDNVSRLGAALAFYTVVAVAPLLTFAVMAAEIFFREEAARRHILSEIQRLIGADAARAIQSVQLPYGGHEAAVTAWISAVVFALGGLGVFTQLQSSLNTIWHAQRRPGENWTAIVKRRLFSLGTVAATSFIMLVSLIVSAALSWFGEHASRWASWPPVCWEILNFIFSVGVVTFLFAVIFKLLPDAEVGWRDVWIGAAVTASLFDAGKTILGFYLAHTHVVSSYGAAGSIIALLLWCYYTGQIFLIGAEFTWVHAATNGGRMALEKR